MHLHQRRVSVLLFPTEKQPDQFMQMTLFLWRRSKFQTAQQFAANSFTTQIMTCAQNFNHNLTQRLLL